MQKPETIAKIVQFIFIASLVPALIGSLMLSLLWIENWPLLFGVIVYAFLGHFFIQLLAKQKKNVNWFLSIAMINLLILTPEIYLRVGKFRYETGIQFAYPRSFVKFIEDEELFWTLPPNESGTNSWGFPGEEISSKTDNVCRILFLGDSVPMQGYPVVVEQVLNDKLPDVQVESVSLAMSGYSSHQGRVLADKYGATVEPDLVVISYGWNDHWLAYGTTDSQKVLNLADRSWVQTGFIFAYNNMRLLQWFRYTTIPLLGAEVSIGEVRVPLNEYVDNLRYMGDFFTNHNALVMFITPPTAHLVQGVPDYHVVDGFAESKESVIQLHLSYNEALRNLAADRPWLLLDLEAEMIDLAEPSQIFISDGIHFTDFGTQQVGERIAEALMGHGCLTVQE